MKRALQLLALLWSVSLLAVAGAYVYGLMHPAPHWVLPDGTPLN